MKSEQFITNDEAEAIEERTPGDAAGGPPRPFGVYYGCDEVFAGRFRTWDAARAVAVAYAADGEAFGLVMADEPFRGGWRRRVVFRVTRE